MPGPLKQICPSIGRLNYQIAIFPSNLQFLSIWILGMNWQISPATSCTNLSKPAFWKLFVHMAETLKCLIAFQEAAVQTRRNRNLQLLRYDICSSCPPIPRSAHAHTHKISQNYFNSLIWSLIAKIAIDSGNNVSRLSRSGQVRNEIFIMLSSSIKSIDLLQKQLYVGLWQP